MILSGAGPEIEILPESAKADRGLLPAWAKELLDKGQPSSRVVADVVSGLTEERATHLYNRLTGHQVGHLVDPVF